MLLDEDAGVVRVVFEMVEARELRVHALVRDDLLVGGQSDLLPVTRPGEVTPALLRIVPELDRGPAHVRETADVLAGREPGGDFQDRLLAHPVHEDVRRAVDENGMADPVAPVVVVSEAPERCLDAAEHDRDVGEQLLQLARVHGARVIRPSARGCVGRVRVG